MESRFWFGTLQLKDLKTGVLVVTLPWTAPRQPSWSWMRRGNAGNGMNPSKGFTLRYNGSWYPQTTHQVSRRSAAHVTKANQRCREKGVAYLARPTAPDGPLSQGGGWRTDREGKRIEGPQRRRPGRRRPTPARPPSPCCAAATPRSRASTLRR